MGRKSNPLFTCPEHGLTVKHKVRQIREDDGSKRYGGEYFACPMFGAKCDYAVGIKSGRASGKIAKKYNMNDPEKRELDGLIAGQKADMRGNK